MSTDVPLSLHMSHEAFKEFHRFVKKKEKCPKCGKDLTLHQIGRGKKLYDLAWACVPCNYVSPDYMELEMRVEKEIPK